MEVWGYADLGLDLTPGTGRVGLSRETPRLEAVLGKTHRTEFERGRRKRGLWWHEEPAAQPKGCLSVTLHLRLRAPVLYSTTLCGGAGTGGRWSRGDDGS
jgi:hypothetical protein